MYQQFSLVKLLLEANADVNLKDDEDCTSLICAVCNDDHEASNNIIKLLLKANADIDARDIGGLTVLMHAAIMSTYEKPN